jgi:hypothetical protein
MKRLIIAAVAAAGLFAVPTAPATIHPIMLGWWCGNAFGNPPGQTPGANHSDQSTLRALQATGLLHGVWPRRRSDRTRLEVLELRPGDPHRHAK